MNELTEDELIGLLLGVINYIGAFLAFMVLNNEFLGMFNFIVGTLLFGALLFFR